MDILTRLPMPATLLYCIVIGAVLIYAPFFVVAIARLQVGYDMSAPREMVNKFPPYAKRANWAHQNSFESFTLFAPAALMAYVTGQDSTLAVGAAIAYVLARSLYSVFYILDVPVLRSAMFAVGNVGIFTLFILSCRSAVM
ncbi:MAPEG family protein [Oscillatoria sp. CS-180]|uniref:MAPEG family protein n=1 Tax=Oscillatoria sp. CS-180 TaxID=3021720 RepID=UPI00232CC7E5|nr:MAPEG family protein [Oscillatoria sp. CS-180]MDB9525959.1 MAPEG family protein [Oscillatoria sp. CS-180]